MSSPYGTQDAGTSDRMPVVGGEYGSSTAAAFGTGGTGVAVLETLRRGCDRGVCESCEDFPSHGVRRGLVEDCLLVS